MILFDSCKSTCFFNKSANFQGENSFRSPLFLRDKKFITYKTLIDALLLFLKTWEINAEVRYSDECKRTKKVTFTDFGLALPQNYKFNREESNVR
jgi:hypothetical protein